MQMSEIENWNNNHMQWFDFCVKKQTKKKHFLSETAKYLHMEKLSEAVLKHTAIALNRQSESDL